MAADIFQTCLGVPGLSTSECASWVQALGSIGAIVGAFLVGNSQIRAARAQRREELASRVRSVAAMLATCINATNGIASDFDRLALPPSRVSADLWLESARQLASLDPFLLPSPELVYLVVGLPTQLRGLHDAYEAFDRVITLGPQRAMGEAFRDQLTRTSQLLDEARKECERYAAGYLVKGS